MSRHHDVHVGHSPTIDRTQNDVGGLVDSVTTQSTSGSVSLVQYLGFSGGALVEDGWHDGHNVNYFETQTNTLGAPYVSVWGSNTSDISWTQNNITVWNNHAGPGGTFFGKIPCFNVPLGFNSASLTTVAAGTQNAMYATLANSFKSAGMLTPIIRMGHEFTIVGAFPWSIDGSSGQQTNYHNAWRQAALAMLNVLPGIQFEISAYTCFYDWTSAYPGDDIITFIGADVYDGWGGAGSTKTSTTDPYATYVDPAAAWAGAWANGNLASPIAGSNAWVYNLALAHGKKFAMQEWGLVARQIDPTTAGGDNPYFINRICDLLATGNVHHANYFCEAATYNGGWQNHDLTPSTTLFVNGRSTFIGRFAP